MIKRRFYKQDHGDNSGSSDSSSSDESDDSFLEVEEKEEEEEERVKENDKNTLCFPSSGSGYESEDSSNNQGDDDASDLLTNEEEMSGENIRRDIKTTETRIKMDPNPNYPFQTELPNFILKFKSVFKCRLCPRILCLNEDTVRTHLSSKRHARSKKLHEEGRLKLMLNSDGELEEEQETHAERHARILALSEKPKVDGLKRQNKRRKKRTKNASSKRKSEPSIRNCSKKRRTVDG